MGLFDWVANGLGFEGGSKKNKEKKSKVAVQYDKYSSFNLQLILD